LKKKEEGRRCSCCRNSNRPTASPPVPSSIACVDSTKLRPWQAKALYPALRPALGFLHRLRERMEKRGFPPGDKLYRLTANAYEALHALSIELHHMSCESGVGRKPQP
jgi:hypothetical protein